MVVVPLQHSSGLIAHATMDADIYDKLTAEGWKLTLSFCDGRPYVRMYRGWGANRENTYLHRYVMGMQFARGRAFEVHHKNALCDPWAGLHNCRENLVVLEQRQHRQLHADYRKLKPTLSPTIIGQPVATC